MKTITLSAKQRQEIQERRRQARDRRIFQRLSTLLWIDEGRTRDEVAELLGVSSRQVGDWLRIFRNKGLDELCTVHYHGDPGRLRTPQVDNFTGDRQRDFSQRRAGAGLDRGAVRCHLLSFRGEGSVAPDRCQLPQSLRLFSGRRTGRSSVNS